MYGGNIKFVIPFVTVCNIALTLEVKRGRDVCEQIPVYAEWGEARFMKEAYARAQRLSAVYEEECRRLGG